MKIAVLFFLPYLLLYGVSTQVVPIAKKDINWKEQLTSKNVKLVRKDDTINCKEYLDIKTLKNKKYRASHYILKNRPICKDDAYIPKSNKIKFNFGSIIIEKEGKVIRETDSYIKIKNLDGKIEKIYKDERGQ